VPVLRAHRHSVTDAARRDAQPDRAEDVSVHAWIENVSNISPEKVELRLSVNQMLAKYKHGEFVEEIRRRQHAIHRSSYQERSPVIAESQNGEPEQKTVQGAQGVDALGAHADRAAPAVSAGTERMQEETQINSLIVHRVRHLMRAETSYHQAVESISSLTKQLEGARQELMKSESARKGLEAEVEALVKIVKAERDERATALAEAVAAADKLERDIATLKEAMASQQAASWDQIETLTAEMQDEAARRTEEAVAALADREAEIARLREKLKETELAKEQLMTDMSQTLGALGEAVAAADKLEQKVEDMKQQQARGSETLRGSMIKARERTMRKIVSRMIRICLARALERWHSRTVEAKCFRNTMTRIVHRLGNRCAALALEAWCSHMEDARYASAAEKHRIVLVRRSLKRMLNKLLASAFSTIHVNAWDQKVMRLKAKRIVKRLRNSAVNRAFALWFEHTREQMETNCCSRCGNRVFAR
jgi:chromosome segregation ATPase